MRHYYLFITVVFVSSLHAMEEMERLKILYRVGAVMTKYEALPEVSLEMLRSSEDLANSMEAEFEGKTSGERALLFAERATSDERIKTFVERVLQYAKEDVEMKAILAKYPNFLEKEKSVLLREYQSNMRITIASCMLQSTLHQAKALFGAEADMTEKEMEDAICQLTESIGISSTSDSSRSEDSSDDEEADIDADQINQ